jgi:hypothetical protein
MARYVLLSFSSNADAEDFVLEYQARLEGRSLDMSQPEYEIDAVYGKPTQFCTPGDGHRGRRRASGYTRGKRFGWWVCAMCGKPEAPLKDKPLAVMVQANNLLEEIINAGESVELNPVEGRPNAEVGAQEGPASSNEMPQHSA